MKLIFAGNTAWSMYNFRRFVFQHFIKQGHEVIVLAPHDNEYQPLIASLGCKFYPIQIEGKGHNPLKDIRTILQFRKIFKKEKPDYCFFYTIKPNIYGSLAAASLHIPYIPITTGLGYIFLTNNLISKIAQTLYKVAFKKAPQIWFLNEDDANTFVCKKLIRKEQAHILKGEGIDVDYFEVHNEYTETSFLLVARMLWDKGVGEFVEAATKLKKKYPEVKFQLLGFLGVNNPNAISQEQMNKWIQEGNIEYLGSTNDVRPFLYQSSCVVLPSFYREGIPFSLMEGAAAGKPLIATNNIGCKDVIDHGITGFLVNKRDSEDLAKAMEKIILMPKEKRIDMGLKGRQKMQKEFGLPIIIKQYDQIISNTIKSK